MTSSDEPQESQRKTGPVKRQAKPKAVRAKDVKVVWRPAGTRSEGLAPGPRQAEVLASQRAERTKKGQGDD